MRNITVNDIWLLLSIIVGGKGGEASYHKIIKVGDMINHAIFNHDQIENGLFRLSENNLIIKSNGGYTPTSLAMSDFSQVKDRSKNWFDAWDALKVKYDAVRDLESLNVNSYPGYSREDVDLAIQSYQDEIKEHRIKTIQKEYRLSREEAEKEEDRRMGELMEWINNKRNQLKEQ